MRYKYRVRKIVGHGPGKEHDYYFFTETAAKAYAWYLKVFTNRKAYIKKLN